MSVVIRLAQKNDADKMLAIYAHYVRETVISFECAPPPLVEFTSRIKTVLERAPWLACDVSGEIVGYAYAGRFHTRDAYQWTVETSVYVHRNRRRQGIGAGLYATLLDCLRAQGFYRAVAVIALPNPGSIALHERFGFKPAGVCHAVGRKHGRWIDVGYWELALRDDDHAPCATMSVAELAQSEAWEDAVRKGVALARSASPLGAISHKYDKND